MAAVGPFSHHTLPVTYVMPVSQRVFTIQTWPNQIPNPLITMGELYLHCTPPRRMSSIQSLLLCVEYRIPGNNLHRYLFPRLFPLVACPLPICHLLPMVPLQSSINAVLFAPVIILFHQSEAPPFRRIRRLVLVV
jgi:hypothetical protein